MLNHNSIYHYSDFSFEDFLQDDFFITSIKNPTEDSIHFWTRFEDEKFSNTGDYVSAKYFLESAEVQNDIVSDGSLSTVFERIETTNKRNKRSQFLRRSLYIGISVAACVAILIVSINYIAIPDLGDNALVSFAQQNSSNTSVPSSDKVTLILSEEKTVEIEDDESVISYTDKEKIQTNNQDISKEEVAAYNQLIVPKGKRSQLTLPDGTHLHINSGTHVVYPTKFSDKQREIYVNGEIFLDVVPDKTHPFVVRTSSLNVKVLGTSFNVMAYEDETETQVVLASGSVQILDAKKTIIKPSDMYCLNEGEMSVSKVDVSKYTSWIDGVYNLKSESLESIARRLSRYYGVAIHCDANTKNLKCTGKVDLKENIGVVLDGLTYILPIKIEEKEKTYNIILK